jgi:hypothetical protein
VILQYEISGHSIVHFACLSVVNLLSAMHGMKNIMFVILLS